MEKINVLFVCLGNICRSPMGEGMFEHLVEEAGLSDQFRIDSAGTSAHHVGEQADHRMRQTAGEKGIVLRSRARQFKRPDFSEFDYLIAMDRSNRRNMLKLGEPAEGNQLFLMRDFDDNADIPDVPDPYWSGQDGFEEVYDIVRRSCTNLLAQIRKEREI